MKLTKILTFVFIGVSLYMGYYVYSSVETTINERKFFSVKEAAVIEKMKLIREAEIIFQEVHGRYTSNWDSLINFIEQGKVPIVERKEEIIQKDYGAEETIVHIDTLGYVTARERIFKQNFSMSSKENGTFMGFLVKVGDKVMKNQRAYSIQVDGKLKKPPFTEEGFIASLADLKVGDEVKKNKVLITFWDYRFSPDLDVSRLAYKPSSPDQNAPPKFDIFVGKVDKNGIAVDVIEVKDPSPDDPRRSEQNEAKNRKPLRFGSKIDVSTSGNWE